MTNQHTPSQQQTMQVPVTDTQGYCPIRSTVQIFKDDTRYTDGIAARMVAFNTGQQLKEMVTKLRMILDNFHPLVVWMEKLAVDIQRGEWDHVIEHNMLMVNAEPMLAVDMAMMYASIRSAAAQGADVAGAYRAYGAAQARGVRTGEWAAPNLRPFTFHGRTAA